MTVLRYTLLSDGPADRALLPVIRWVMTQHVPDGVSLRPEFADLRKLPNPPRGLSNRISRTVELFPCELLFVHRDAEGEPVDARVKEIGDAAQAANLSSPPTIVPVVPIRMTEAWLLFDESAIRKASGNPNGTTSLGLPPLNRCESIPDPKTVLDDALRKASGLGSRRLRSFRTTRARPRVAELIQDFSPLRNLPAFEFFEHNVRQVVP